MRVGVVFALERRHVEKACIVPPEHQYHTCCCCFLFILMSRTSETVRELMRMEPLRDKIKEVWAEVLSVLEMLDPATAVEDSLMPKSLFMGISKVCFAGATNRSVRTE